MTDASTADGRTIMVEARDEPAPAPCAESASAADSLSRREFLIVGAAGVAGAVAASSLSKAGQAAEPATVRAAFPVVDVVPLADIREGNPISFEYPDADSPAVMVALPESARGGVGPDSRIVAFSILCTHKGCPVNFLPERRMFVCPCHWSSFDPAKGGQMVIGQGSEPLPQIRLRVQNGIVQAYGVDGLIYGRHTNIL